MALDMERAKDLVRKLLATAGDDAATEGEIDNALAMARRIMLKHNFGEGDIPKEPHELARELENTKYDQKACYSFSQGLTEWEISLIWAICELMGTVKWYIGGKHVEKRTRAGVIQRNKDGSPKLATLYYLYGPDRDVAEAVELIYEWQEITVAMSRMKYGGFVRGAGRSYANGFCMALHSKVKNLRKEETQQAAIPGPQDAPRSSTALILVQSNELMRMRKERASEWLERECGIKLGKGGSRSSSGSFDGEAYHSGRTDGGRADLTRKSGTTRHERLD